MTGECSSLPRVIPGPEGSRLSERPEALTRAAGLEPHAGAILGDAAVLRQAPHPHALTFAGGTPLW